ncbi:MAG: daunorubicin/doxorubicin resistance ABC transporter ATP-binding protein DrrA, partial [Acidothermaceae bacterium]
DRGKVIAAGTAAQLKDRVGGDVLEFTVPERSRLADAAAAVADIAEGDPQTDAETGRVTIGVGARSSASLVEAVRRLDAAGVVTDGLAVRRPSLDDVFLAVTGHAAEDETVPAPGRRGRGRGRGKPEPAESEGGRR